jgi:RHS repeat-associated protein
MRRNTKTARRALTIALLITAGACSAQAAEASYAAQVTGKPVFFSPLEWHGPEPASESESQALLESIASFKSGPKAGMASLESFLASNPRSGWGPSLRVNMAEYYRSKGRYTLALAHWEEAWGQTKTGKAPATQSLAARALAGWTRLLASLGQKARLEALFQEAEQLNLPLGTASTTIQETKEGLAMMKTSPGDSYRCGSLALGNMARALRAEKTPIHNLFEAQSPEGGFRLSQLLEMAQTNGLAVEAVRRPAGGEIVVPSVVHWKLNHYAAIVDRKDDYYKVIDPTFEGHVWMDAQTLDAEASGAFLVPAEQVPANWQKVSAAECALIYGKGFPNQIHDADDAGPDSCDPEEGADSDCDPPSANDGPSGDGSSNAPPCGCGMPVWKVSEPYITVWLQDVPLLYRQSNGKWMSLKLRYKHRGEFRGSKLPSFGKNWECNWLGALTKDSPTADVYTNHMAGGGISVFNTNGALEYATARKLLLGVPGVPSIAAPSGSSLSYSASATLDSGGTAYTMTRQSDRYGRTVFFNYATNGTGLVLTNVYDLDGRTNTLTYTNAGTFANLIASVTDPYGRTARFYYDSIGRLTNITDAMSMQTSLQYDSSDRVTNMTTLYGPTVFQYLDGVSTNVSYAGTIRRSVLVTEPSGDHQLFAYVDNGPAGIQADGPTFEHYRNSYHWNRAQFASIPGGHLGNLLDLPDADYLRARVSHWLHGLVEGGVGGSKTVSGTLNATAGAFDANGFRAMTSFNYYGQTADNQIGTLKRITGYTTPLSKALDIGRNTSGRPTNITYLMSDLTGGTTTFSGYTNAYDASGTRLLSQKGPHGEWVRRYGYHPVVTNLLISVTNALNEVTSYTHDTNTMQVTGISLPSGLLRTNFYYTSGPAKGFLQMQIDVGFRTNSFGYVNGNLAAQTNELGLVTTYAYDSLNRLVSTAFPDGTTISNIYDKLDLVAVKDRLNQWTRYGYNLLGQRTAETNANSQVTQYTYCGCGSPSQITRWNNGVALTTQFTYDLDGRLTNTVYADGYQVNRAFDSSGLLHSVTDSGGREVDFQYSQMGRETVLALAQSPTSYLYQSYQYDEYARLTNSVDRNGVRTVSAYDLLGRLTNRLVVSYSIDVVHPGPESFAYDSRGLTNYFDQLGHPTAFVRDALGRELFETNANQEVLQFTYNPSDELLTLTDGKNQTTTWRYDTYGRVTNKVDALGTNSFIYAYDANDRLTNRTSAAKGATGYRYDPIGNLTNVVYPVSSNLVFKYDGLNRLTNMLDGVGSTVFGWTPGSQLATEDGPWPGDTVSYSYTDRLRTALQLSQPNASPWVQNYTYDTDYRLSTTASPAGGFSYAYEDGPVGNRHASLLMNSLTYPYGSTTVRIFDDVGRLESISSHETHFYYYDAASERTQHVFTAGNYVDYTYDNLGQLKTAKGYDPGGSARLHEQFGYAYDKAWNLSSRTNNALVQTFSANAANELSSVSRSGTLTIAGSVSSTHSPSVTVSGIGAAAVYSDATWARAGATPANGPNTYTATASDSYGRTSTDSITVTSSNSVSFVYDANGNLLSDGNRNFAYDDENQLISVWVANSWRSDFVYDGLMRRRIRREYSWASGIWNLKSEIRYTYDGNLVIQERDANNLATVTYTRGIDLSGSLQGAGGIGGLLARSDNRLLLAGSASAHAYYHSDGNGNVTSLVNGSSSVVAQYLYDPFGNLLAKSGPLADANLYRFSSKECHPNSGLAHYLYRYYDSNLQRWLSRDPIGETGCVNLYSAFYNNPISSLDPLGLLNTTECNALRVQIFTKAKDLLDDLRRYDPVADGRGGFPMAGGKLTKPGGHYIEIKQRQRGIKNDILRYIKGCINNNDDDNPSIPRYVDDMANRPVQPPVFPPAPSPFSWIQPIDSWSINPQGAMYGLSIAGGVISATGAAGAALSTAGAAALAH